jgi:hypothetical protein
MSIQTAECKYQSATIYKGPVSEKDDLSGGLDRLIAAPQGS